MPNIGTVWSRVFAHAGQIFHTVSGIPFTYDCGMGYIRLKNTERNIPKSNFAKVLSCIPLGNVAKVQRLGVQGPAYLYAILIDPRIRQNDW